MQSYTQYVLFAMGLVPPHQLRRLWVALGTFEQPDAQMQSAHSVALFSDHAKTGLIALKMNVSKLKQKLVIIHMISSSAAEASEDAALDTL